MPDEAARLLIHLATAQKMTVLTERFAVGGKFKDLVVETQLHDGPAIDTSDSRWSFMPTHVRLKDP
ncbi:MAG TPA: hypothetical protein VFG07_10625 [Thermoplasmata archaeon]|nr:hypothetical protein [Thermoplasmata archaeon]